MFTRILSHIPHTRKLHLGVIGFPSSGKSYLLSDLIATLTEMGFESELPPLSYPHSSLGAFFYDAYNNDGGGMKQTPPSACRTNSHYGAVMNRKGTNQRIQLDFLNIPGETFKNPNIQLTRYYNLRNRLSAVRKGLFDLTTWRCPSGHEIQVIEPALEVRQQFGLTKYDSISKTQSASHIILSSGHYMPWPEIYSLLNAEKYSLERRKSVDGKYILRHFFELNTDSIFATLTDVWNGFASNLIKGPYMYENAFNDFYYMHYCSFATDVILCDKIFTPSSTRGESDGNFDLMTNVLNGLLRDKRHKAHVYLAFRGADLMMKRYAVELGKTLKDKELHDRRKGIYERFLKEFNKYSESKLAMLDMTPENFSVVTGGDVLSHIKSRLGDNAHCFRNLLKNTYRSKRHYESPGNLLPPHVYFTATPIDSDFNFYDNDDSDKTRFIRRSSSRTGKQKWKAFHIEMTRGNKRQLCFGSYQLMTDIFEQNNIYIKK